MPAIAKIRILFADEDELRRDGLAAVLSGSDCFEVIAGSADGVAALENIRDQRPDVAVVDLNLPKLHGIELIRRVRSEVPGTKVIILAGTADDEIVREAVRAGADGYLLKNSPARHLIDAISYVRDGGQYFSPQLRRDGRERHLLEEPVRQQEPSPSAAPSKNRAGGGNASAPAGPDDPSHFRERIRQEAPPELNEHDYEIMSMMADGIRPILERLDEIDTRVAQMEIGDEPVPADPQRWLSTQFANTVSRQRGDIGPGRSAGDVEARLPELIEEAVSKRFHQMADKLQQEIEETHVRTLESFVKNIQTKLVQRVSALEQDMSKQADAMGQLRDYSQRTEDNLSRLISGVDRLAQELPRRLAAASEPQPEPVPDSSSEDLRPELATKVSVRRTGHSRKMKWLWAAASGLILAGALGWGAFQFGGRSAERTAPADGAVTAPRAEKAKVPAGADTKTKMQAAQDSMDRKDYAAAEDLYKQIVKSEPANTDALKALASVLYREEKLEESVAVMDKISKD